MAAKPITICTVSFNNLTHLELNLRLAEKMNPDHSAVSWVIAENSPVEPERSLASGDGHVKVIAGYRDGGQANVNHAEALHHCLRHVDSRFLLIMDPDYYLLRNNWAEDVTNHMIANNIAFFGAPWHPRFKDKYRYFPCVHCMFIDLQQVPLEELDFRPIVSHLTMPPAISDKYDFDPPESWFYKAAATGYLGRSLQSRYREYIDTGSRLYHKFYRQRALKHECVTPVWDRDGDAGAGRSGDVPEYFLPDRLCYYPAKSSYTTRGLLSESYYQHAPDHWDEFVWQNAPFGFHVRRNANKSTRDDEDELRRLRIIIEEICRCG